MEWIPQVLRKRDFALLWAGQSVSMAGDGIFTVAIALEALSLDHSPTGLSFVLAARIGPAVCLLPLGGAVVDRAPRRLIMLAADAGRGLAVGLIALAAATGTARLWELLAMAVAFGAGDAFFGPASIAIVPELLPTELLVPGSSLTATSKQAAQGFIGPALGGLLVVSAGIGGALAVDTASFAVSAACLLAMTNRRRRPVGRPATASSSPRRSLLADARDGLRYCASRRWLWVAVASHGFISMIAIGPLFVLVPLLIEQVMGQSGAVLGLVIAAGGLGGVTGAILAGHIRVSRRRITAMWVSLGVAGMMVVALAAASNAWYAGLSFGLVWVFTTYANVLWSPILQEQIPADMLGRAASLEWMASFAGTPLGIIGAGLLAAAAGVRATLLGGGILAALVVLGLFVPGVRDPERAQSVLGQPTALDRTL